MTSSDDPDRTDEVTRFIRRPDAPPPEPPQPPPPAPQPGLPSEAQRPPEPPRRLVPPPITEHPRSMPYPIPPPPVAPQTPPPRFPNQPAPPPPPHRQPGPPPHRTPPPGPPPPQPSPPYPPPAPPQQPQQQLPTEFTDAQADAPTFHHQPIPTNFTTAEPDTPTWQQNLNAPAAGDLGLIRRPPPPRRGWRKAIHRVTGGTVNLGESEYESSSRQLTGRVNQPVRGAYSIAVLSLKGGVGKTTTTVGLGTTFASIRGDRVIAVDANPDFGTLAQRGPNETRSTVRDLLADENLFRYSDVRKHTSQNSSRLEILASERDPAVSEAFSESDYRAVHEILDRFYNIILTDCGTGLTHSAMKGVLDCADTLVLVASPAIDSARSALATLDWLYAHGYAHLIPDATVVLSSARPGSVPIDLERLTRHFQTRVRSVFLIPFDDHLAEGAEISLELMNRKTRQAFMDLTAAVADSFNRARQTPR